ncbi:hypothetical protein NUU61_006130 [Penicillium alfredii]|uniref:VWFA domain-containing protein n=1 Tax=Penicillium alfredii TaxID=1506179 RepID=A0A9W9K3C0_9EURO|nr:uncharacterized protein NUU61_006130 [Penicillium alfredii]KAJ5091260.1 hypothetical protein NUU61_006130 [Penicillium alfredii]
MSILGRPVPPPLWSSFPSSRLSGHQHRESALAITPDASIMGNEQSRICRHSSLLSRFRPGSKRARWQPPAYESRDWKVPQTTKTSMGDSDSRYAFLRDFDTIFLVDDSSSMSGPRWHEAEEAISAITPICTQYDADGIDLYFLNHRRASHSDPTGAYRNITTADDVQEIFSGVRPRGATPVGKRLLEILAPYLRQLERVQAGDELAGAVKPVNIIAITDGEFTDDAESVIVQVARTLDHPRCNALPWQVGIQFFQIGADEHVRRYLEELDDDLGTRCRDERLRDIVDTVPWKGRRGQVLDADGILKCVLGAVNKKLDRRQVS